MGSRPAKISSLDGLRAISIALVLFSHLVLTRGFPQLPETRFFTLLGSFGVRIFFVISGFLITSLLLEEHRKTGRVDLKAFYIRRCFRIFPAFYLFVGAMLIFGTVPFRDLLHALTYTMNFHEDRAWVLGHLWSLSVEEQFYFLWPAVLLLAGPARALRVAAAVILIAPVLRVLTWVVLPEHRGLIGEAFPTIADAIATGCVLAGIRESLDCNGRYLAFLRSSAFILVPLAALSTVVLADRPSFSLPLGQTIANVAIAILIDRCVRFPPRVLNNRPIEILGTLSYSLYLWQQPFMRQEMSFPMNVIPIVVLSVASYLLVERPMLRLRARLGWGNARGALDVGPSRRTMGA